MPTLYMDRVNLNPTSITKHKILTHTVVILKVQILGNYSKTKRPIKTENQSKVTAKMKVKKC